MHNDKFNDNASISSHMKPTNPLSDSAGGPADLPTAYQFPNRTTPYPHYDALDRFSTTSPADNSHGHPDGESDGTSPGAPTILGHSILRPPSKNYYIGYVLFNDLLRLCTCSHSMSWQCPHARPGGIPCEIFSTYIACPYRTRVARPTLHVTPATPITVIFHLCATQLPQLLSDQSLSPRPQHCLHSHGRMRLLRNLRSSPKTLPSISYRPCIRR